MWYARLEDGITPEYVDGKVNDTPGNLIWDGNPGFAESM